MSKQTSSASGDAGESPVWAAGGASRALTHRAAAAVKILPSTRMENPLVPDELEQPDSGHLAGSERSTRPSVSMVPCRPKTSKSKRSGADRVAP